VGCPPWKADTVLLNGSRFLLVDVFFQFELVEKSECRIMQNAVDGDSGREGGAGDCQGPESCAFRAPNWKPYMVHA
jgi:hypothetical protein